MKLDPIIIEYPLVSNRKSYALIVLVLISVIFAGLLLGEKFWGKDGAADDVARANHIAMVTAALKAAKPGDLAVQTGGQTVVLGAGRDFVVHNDMVQIGSIHWVHRNVKPVDVFAKMVEHVASKNDPDYSTLASCHFKGKVVIRINYRYTCGD